MLQVQPDGQLRADDSQQVQGCDDSQIACESPHSSPAKITGLVYIEDGNESVEVQPSRSNSESVKTRPENPFAKPADMPMEVEEAAKEQVEQHKTAGKGVDVSVTEQRGLKKQIEEEQKEKAEKKKHEAENKKKEAAQVALMKAEAKLAKAQAKAKALEDKKHKVPLKRKLDAQFAGVADDDKENPPVSPPKPKRSRAKKTPNTKKKQQQGKVVLSPKAKAFAVAASSKGPTSREHKAQIALGKLRDLNLSGLELPDETFSKMILACICVHIYIYIYTCINMRYSYTYMYVYLQYTYTHIF